jgi:hypothetical protein
MDGNGQTVKIHDGHLPAQKHKNNTAKSRKSNNPIDHRTLKASTMHTYSCCLIVPMTGSASLQKSWTSSATKLGVSSSRHNFCSCWNDCSSSKPYIPSPTHQKLFSHTETPHRNKSIQRSNVLPW